eukprot:s16831_g1.t1
MEGDASDKNIAFMLQDDEADGPYYHQEWEGMKQTTPIISGEARLHRRVLRAGGQLRLGQEGALDQSSRYADLSLDEATLVKRPSCKVKAGYDYLATAAHFAAESSTGTNVNVCTTDDFTKSVDALVYYIDPDSEE